MENIENVTIDDILDEAITPVEIKDYDSLDKIDLVRLLKDKDVAIESYEKERANINDHWNQELANMNSFYTKKISGLNAVINYHERKFKMLIDLINIEKDPKLTKEGE